MAEEQSETADRDARLASSMRYGRQEKVEIPIKSGRLRSVIYPVRGVISPAAPTCVGRRRGQGTFVPSVFISDYADSLIVMGMLNHGSYGNDYNLVHPVRELGLVTSIYRSRTRQI